MNPECCVCLNTSDHLIALVQKQKEEIEFLNEKVKALEGIYLQVWLEQKWTNLIFILFFSAEGSRNTRFRDRNVDKRLRKA
jgi:hypothetical protein